MLVVSQVGQEPEHRHDVRPPHRRVQCLRGVGGEAAEPGSRRLADQERHHEEGDEGEDQPGVARLGQAHRADDVPPVGRPGERHQGGHAEDEHGHGDERQLVRIRDRQEREQAAQQVPGEAARVEDEGPEDQEVGDSHPRVVEHAALARHVDDDAPEAPGQVIPARLGPPPRHGPQDPVDPPPEQGERDQGQGPQEDEAGDAQQGRRRRIRHQRYPFRFRTASARASRTSVASSTTP